MTASTRPEYAQTELNYLCDVDALVRDLPLSEIEDVPVLFVIGSNTTETHPVLALRMKKAVRRGSKLIVADPRRIDLVRFAHLHLHSEYSLLDGLTRIPDLVKKCKASGMPAVADPGSSVVRAAHAMGLEVVPLVGPVSLLLALAASGLNGQHFAFVGYLPQEATARLARLKQLEQMALKTGQTQIWIETPYRNAAVWGAAATPYRSPQW